MEETKLRQWVEIEQVLIEPQDRLEATPADTRSVALTMRAAGFLLQDTAAVGDVVRIRTPVGRILEGTLTRINPQPSHGFGPPVHELQRIGPMLRKLLEEGETS